MNVCPNCKSVIEFSPFRGVCDCCPACAAPLSDAFAPENEAALVALGALMPEGKPTQPDNPDPFLCAHCSVRLPTVSECKGVHFTDGPTTIVSLYYCDACFAEVRELADYLRSQAHGTAVPQ